MTNETLKNPSVPTLPNPVGIDVAIQQLQLSLATLPWLEKSFGRAWSLPSTILGKSVLEPKVYQAGKEYYPVLPNDALKSYSFFSVQGARSTEEYQANMNNGTFYFRDPANIIFWCDLEAIDPTKDYVFKEELIREVLNVLNQDPNVEVVRVWDDKVEDIYRGYSLQPNHRDLLMYPYTAFRVEIFLRYGFQCAGLPVVAPPSSVSIFTELLKVAGGITDTLKTVMSAIGIGTPLKLSNTKVGIGNFNDVENSLKGIPTQYHTNSPNRLMTAATSAQLTSNNLALNVSNRIRAYPFIIGKNVSFDRLVFEITGGSPGTFHVGLYADNGNIYPGQKVVSVSAEISAVGVRSIDFPKVDVVSGLYWIVSAQEGPTPIVRALPPAAIAPVLGFTDLFNNNALNGTNFFGVYTPGPLPDEYPANANTFQANQPQIAVGFRVAT